MYKGAHTSRNENMLLRLLSLLHVNPHNINIIQAEDIQTFPLSIFPFPITSTWRQCEHVRWEKYCLDNKKLGIYLVCTEDMCEFFAYFLSPVNCCFNTFICMLNNSSVLEISLFCVVTDLGKNIQLLLRYFFRRI
jgi:hypothetical protein